ncbi:MAG: adenine phosphoribosyltransferase [Bradymonadaceae bacterium]|nr:adenine phosphoribosyltransferase [Lujinxingiaceae bacterium]
MRELDERVKATIRDIPDFPKVGIVFKDITPVLQDGALFGDITAHFKARYADQGLTHIVGIESRGFVFGAALANAMGLGLTLVRKPGKLPYKTVGVDYALEYGTDRVEMHTDALGAGDRVLIIDDLLATGGTCAATCELVRTHGGHIVECAFAIELAFLHGRERLGCPVYALTSY